MAGKKVFIIFAHMDRKNSFNGAMLDAAITSLESVGHEVKVSDLYEMGFNPVIGREDFTDDAKNKDKFDYLHEIHAAYERGSVCVDMMDEFKKLEEADLVILQFPLQWGALPGILKGYLDRVLMKGAAHSAPSMMFDTGKFQGKKVLVSLTTGAPAEFYTEQGMLGEINVLLWPLLHVTLRYVGFDVLPVNFCPGAAFYQKPEVLEGYLKRWKDRLPKSFTEEPIKFPKNVTLAESDSGHKTTFVYNEL